MNPFELRAQILKQAEDYLLKQYEVNTAAAKQLFATLGDNSKQVAMPIFPTIEQILEKAEELYSFVLKTQK